MFIRHFQQIQSLVRFNVLRQFGTKDRNNYYQKLNVDPNASFQQIKEQYIQYSKIHHPDKHSGDRKNFQQIKQAFQTLSNPKKRLLHDHELGISESATWKFKSQLKNDAFENQAFQQIFQQTKKTYKALDIQQKVKLKFQQLNNASKQTPFITKKQQIVGYLKFFVFFGSFWACWKIGEMLIFRFQSKTSFTISQVKSQKKLSMTPINAI